MNARREARYWIEALQLEKHPEGGWFKRQYRSPHQVRGEDIGRDKDETRPLSTTIYFLIDEQNPSHFHELASDEVWFFHDGAPLTLSMIHADGSYREEGLGLDATRYELPQRVVAAGTIFGAFVKEKGAYALVSCMVSYGFTFSDFVLYDQKTLLGRYPQYREQILKMALP